MAQMIASPHAEVKPVRPILGLIACVGIVFTLITLLFGFTTIPANSVGVKTRFGAYHDIINPGLAYAIPYFDEIHIVPTQRLQKLEFGFSTPGAMNMYQGDPQPEETETMITGDLNTALVPWVVQYRITDQILYHPWHKSRVQIARDHRFSFLRLRIALVHVHRAGRGKTELELLQTLGRHDVDFIEVRNCIGQPGINDVVISAEPSLHTDGVCRNCSEPEQ